MDRSLKSLMAELELYIEKNWTGPEEMDRISEETSADYTEEASSEEETQKGGLPSGGPDPAASLEALIRDVGKSFHETLFDLIRESGMTDVEVYKRANMDRRFFSKIRSNPAYHPRKSTVLALAIALKLDLRQTSDLLSRAEYALSPGSKSDVIIRFFIERQIYDIDTINIALYDHHLPILD
ncbi:MAG: hypothetical protein IJX90_09540 [Blautia sp.]|nr:hypothetical protein [Blautia sp.]